MLPNEETSAAMVAARQGELKTVGNIEELLDSLNMNNSALSTKAPGIAHK